MKTIQNCDIDLPELEPVWQDPSENKEHLEAMQKIHSLICVRERSQKELYERLIASDFKPSVVKNAVDVALKCGLISDERYASAFIRGKTNKGWGKAKIISHLHKNGISEQVIENCSEDFASSDQEFDRAVKEVKTHPSHSKNPRASLIRRLVNKGYSFETAHAAVNEALSDAR